jgi:hypothetical protein
VVAVVEVAHLRLTLMSMVLLNLSLVVEAALAGEPEGQ